MKGIPAFLLSFLLTRFVSSDIIGSMMKSDKAINYEKTLEKTRKSDRMRGTTCPLQNF